MISIRAKTVDDVSEEINHNTSMRMLQGYSITNYAVAKHMNPMKVNINKILVSLRLKQQSNTSWVCCTNFD